ncbi:transcriptional regulator, XRE family with cupin sensor [Hathewaya proteolytica DSM 3090]|uniref:Transcriptional regulator, XRE family with cupin sensor n=1 Tax=Hathewaya proteolytica DSM 3090 TaxID=1121331 RepID=A0A1M6PHT7_9CLOT|nr:cupin domain-containing protein [Hathewaya proteolytica]SHK07508.1 transcriptional regulator, XRE family with cupin sensor [Hathewaya proteolytica DSM 3090]
MNVDIGSKIKELRTGKKLTLKDLSTQTGLSIGFLSQLERGLTTIAIDSLEKIATVLGVDLSYFFSIPKENKGSVLKSYEKEIFQIVDSKIITYHLSNDMENKLMLPRIFEILPGVDGENITSYQHKGEEFVYVLEGVLTLILDGNRYELYPGDSAHYDSKIVHNWGNCTNKITRILTVNTPNAFNHKKLGEK